MDAVLLPLPSICLLHLWGRGVPKSGPGSGLESSPGATLAGGEGDWDTAMPTWVMMDEVEEEEVDEGAKTSGEEGGGGTCCCQSASTRTQKNLIQLPFWLQGGECHLGGG